MEHLPIVVEKGLYPKSLRVWCDEGMLQELATLPGVSQVFSKKAWGAYTVLTDPRWDPEQVACQLRAWASLEVLPWRDQRM